MATAARAMATKVSCNKEGGGNGGKSDWDINNNLLHVRSILLGVLQCNLDQWFFVIVSPDTIYFY